MKKKESVTIRMNEDNVEKLRRYSRVENVSQGKFIEDLIEMYDNKKIGKHSRDINEDTKIEYLLRYENYFLKDKDKQVRESIKYTMNGTNIYALRNYFQIPIKQVINLLKEDFKIDEDLEKYIFGYWFSVAFNKAKERFIINEKFDIRMPNSTKAMLNISRCKVASDLQDIKNKIERYSSTDILAEVENYLVKDTEDESIFKEFFD